MAGGRPSHSPAAEALRSRRHRTHLPSTSTSRLDWELLPQTPLGPTVPGRCPGRAGLTHGTRISCTLLMTCLPTMMTRSSCASSMRQPPAAHYSSGVSGQLGGGTGLTPTFWTPEGGPLLC